jgi:hypothetical protein
MNNCNTTHATVSSVKIVELVNNYKELYLEHVLKLKIKAKTLARADLRLFKRFFFFWRPMAVNDLVEENEVENYISKRKAAWYSLISVDEVYSIYFHTQMLYEEKMNWSSGLADLCLITDNVTLTLDDYNELVRFNNKTI